MGCLVLTQGQSTPLKPEPLSVPIHSIDTAKVESLLRKGHDLIGAQHDSAELYIRKGIELSNYLEAPSLSILGYNMLLDLFIAQGKLDSMLVLSGKLVNIPNLAVFINSDYNGYSYSWIHRAQALRQVGAYDEAILAAGKALAAADSIQEGRSQMSALAELGVIYSESGDPEKAMEYILQTEELVKGLELRPELKAYVKSVNLANMAILFEEMGDKAQALTAYRTSNRLFEEGGQSRRLGYGSLSLSAYFKNQGQLDSAIYYGQQALSLFKLVEEEQAKVHAHISLSELETETNLLMLSASRLDTAEALLVTSQDLTNKRRLYRAKALLAEKQGNFREALDFTRQAHLIKDSIFNKEKIEAVAHWKILYELEKKDKAILQLSETNLQQTLAIRKRDQLIIGLVGGFILTALIIVMAIRINRQRVALQTQQASFEAAAEAELSAQSRIAQDLHDSMGSILSAIARQVEPGVSEVDIPATHRMVIQAAEEMRRISHNLMPEELTRFGLAETLQNLFFRLSNPNLNLNVIIHQSLEHLSLTTQLQVYRIIQELVANSIKHAQPSQITAYLSAHEDHLSILVEDDGRGYDPKEITPGMGLKSIQSRVQLLGGKLTITSEKGEGTVNYIELPSRKGQ